MGLKVSRRCLRAEAVLLEVVVVAAVVVVDEVEGAEVVGEAVAEAEVVQVVVVLLGIKLQLLRDRERRRIKQAGRTIIDGSRELRRLRELAGWLGNQDTQQVIY